MNKNIYICILFITGVVAVNAQIVFNATFDNDNKNWKTTKTHSPERISIDQNVAHAGKASLCLDGKNKADRFILTTSPMFKVSPGKIYYFSVCMRRTNPASTCFAMLRGKTSSGKWKSITQIGRKMSGQLNTWQVFEKYVKMPKDVTQAWVYLYNIKSTGKVWYDNIIVKELSGINKKVVSSCRKTASWDDADVLNEFTLLNRQAGVTIKLPFKSETRLLRNDKNLLIKVDFSEAKGYNRRSKAKSNSTGVFKDDSVEIFIASVNKPEKVYQLGVNSKGAVCDLLHETGKSANFKWESNAKIKVLPSKNGWSSIISIPFSVLGINPGKDKGFRFNICRNMPGISLLASWQKLKSGQRGFLQPNRFAHINFKTGNSPSEFSGFAKYRGIGWLSNPDFQKDNTGKIYQWTADGKSLTQNTFTSRLPAGTQLAFTALASDKKPIKLNLEYIAKSGKTIKQTVKLNPASGNKQSAQVKVPAENLRLQKISIENYAKCPYFLQISSSTLRHFSYQLGCYDYLYRKNKNSLTDNSIHLYTLYPYLSITKGMPAPFSIILINTFQKEKYSKLKGKIYLDLYLPKGIELWTSSMFGRKYATVLSRNAKSTIPGHKKITLQVDCNQVVNVNACFKSSLPASKNLKMSYQLRYPGSQTRLQQIPIKNFPSAPFVKPLKRFKAGIYFWLWYSDRSRSGYIFETPQADSIIKHFANCGFNSFYIDNILGFKKIDLPSTDRLIKIIKKNGLEVFLHTGGTINFARTSEKSEKALAVRLDGKKATGLCLSYRGKSYQKMIEAWGDVARHGIYNIDVDWEDWNFVEKKICFCDRCATRFESYLKNKYPNLKYYAPKVFIKSQKKYPILNKKWREFKNILVAEWFRDLRKELIRVAKAKGVSCKPVIGSTGIYKAPWNWRKMLRNGDLNYFSDMLYAYSCFYSEPSIRSCSEKFLKSWKFQKIPRQKYIVTIAPGEAKFGEAVIPDIGAYYQVLEVVGSGAAGFKIWKNNVMSGGKYYWIARALNSVSLVENILLDGKFTRAIDSKKSYGNRISRFVHPAGSVYVASNYGLSKVKIKIPVIPKNISRNVWSLDKRKKLAVIRPRGKSFSGTFDKLRAKMYFIGTNAQWNKILNK
jgi:Carbohydrate family 9 binding domain-like